ncbi:hypothetical protein, partial [Vreelandella indica]|uniref:hypothetical protein n=1 Tax=Vreelandella indica TaxID=3126500 RepID=UPI00300E41CF
GDSGKLPKIGHDKTECAVTIIQNRRSRSNGMGGHDRAEYANTTYRFNSKKSQPYTTSMKLSRMA